MVRIFPENNKFLGLIFSVLIFGSITGCSSLATKTDFYKPITKELHQNNFHAVVEKIEKAKTDKKFSHKNRFLYYLDAGLAYHYAKLYDSSNIRLTAAEEAADELFTKSISKAAASLLLNDNVLEYAGEDYEILYTNLIKAMNYLSLNMFDDAFVEIRRVNNKLNLLDQKYADAATRFQEMSEKDTANVGLTYTYEKVKFNNDAFARYLSMHIYAAEGLYDDAEIDLDWLHRAFKEQPHIYDFEIPEVSYYSQEKAILSVVALTGIAPYKDAFNLRIRTDKDLNLVQVLFTGEDGNESEYTHFALPVSADYYFKLAVPRLVDELSDVHEIRVFADDEPIGQLSLIEDISRVAHETYNAKKSLIYIRSFSRAIYKGLIANKMKKKADNGGLAGWLKKAAIDAGMDATENADLRSSFLLPGKIHVGDFEISPGTYNIRVDYLDKGGATIYTNYIDNVVVKKHDFNLAETIYLN